MNKVFYGLPQSLKEITPVPYGRPHPTQFMINWSWYQSLYYDSYLKHC